ncbi:hypothetical protein [Methanogenium sp. MK-MG]|uniref:hypothetical protein n=1 Tax=Methanogenium sp. MK-MG TaxID=2599926 RepID=UPI0020B13E84|nr:hypothetical protein [Methanogenium sp. MK-MG]KAF1078216.1 hypothetical protein MKMG_00873 [Methanogenium sp. MK-MG]
MSDTPSPGKKFPGQEDKKETHFNASVDVQESDSQYLPAGIRGTKKPLTCIPIRESEKQVISARMSPGSQIILNGTKWSETGYIPSFKDTDKILMKAARRTYTKTHAAPDR